MNAIDFLKNEHHRVKKLLNDIHNNKTYETQIKMFEQLGQDLIRHEEMEHKIWYPYFKNNSKLKDTVHHLLKEENFAEREISKFYSIRDQALWNKKFNYFEEAVIHHAEEEETELFPEVEKLLSTSELDSIGRQMQVFKHDYNSTQL